MIEDELIEKLLAKWEDRKDEYKRECTDEYGKDDCYCAGKLDELRICIKELKESLKK